ncbi:craniofacial development protein 1-like [Teleopsis dalmanni]|uniref:craniofacial development protein 1-like n=1 Tax=Teleopsis dalmanni TaxID=139649 RepID=UPI0018CFD7C2|nr:craniofacial development protein 1-like [Teleopsis dalmanni]
MSKKVDYSSDSDQSDEDFCPENAGNIEQLSEEDTDDEIEESENGVVSAKKVKKSNKNGSKKQKKENTSNDDDIDSSSLEKRNTRQKANSNNAQEKSIIEKDALESDDDEKSRTDALWADFLSDVKVVPKKEKSSTTAISSSKPSSISNKAKSSVQTKSTVEEPKIEKLADEPVKKTLTEVLNFAGEDVVVQKEVSADSIKENSRGSGSKPVVKGIKRFSSGGSGISSIINQIGKKKKMSVLEKSKLDWNSYKEDEGIDDEIKTFNKGKDGFLERQDFLQRTDLRQFEIERNIRQSRRNN